MVSYSEHSEDRQQPRQKQRGFLIEERTLQKGVVREFNSDHDHLLMLTHGRILLDYNGMTDYEVGMNEMFVMPSKTAYVLKAQENTRFVIFCLSVGTHISDLFPLLTDRGTVQNCRFYTVAIRETLATFLDTVITCLEGGVEVINYYEFKFRELLVLMRRFYSREELIRLYCAILKPDPHFVNFVLDNHDKVKTVKELADLSHYSLSAFNRHFREAFGMPPYIWMRHQRAMRLFNMIKNSDDTLQQISDEFDFSSLSQLSNFCKRNFGQTPTQIRKDRNMSSITTRWSQV